MVSFKIDKKGGKYVCLVVFTKFISKNKIILNSRKKIGKRAEEHGKKIIWGSSETKGMKDSKNQQALMCVASIH